MVQQEGGSWKIRHLLGTSLSADGMTKPLQQPAHQRFVELIGMGDDQEEQEVVLKKLEMKNRGKNGTKHGLTAMIMVGSVLLSSEWKWLGALLILCAGVLKRREEKEPLASQDTQDRKKKTRKKSGEDEMGSDQSGTVTPVELAGACILQERKKTRKSGL